MRDYGRIYTTFWTHPTIKSFGEDGRTLAAYLLTCEHSNAIGCYPLPAAYVIDDLSIEGSPWPLERVSKAFQILDEKGWALRFGDNRTICVTQFIDPWNKPENPNVVKRMLKLFDLLPKDPLRYFPLKGILAARGKDGGDFLSRPDRKRLETLSETLWERLPEQYRNPNLSEPIRTLPILNHSNSVPSGANGNVDEARTSSFVASDDDASPPGQEQPKGFERKTKKQDGPSDEIRRSPAAIAARQRQQEKENADD